MHLPKVNLRLGVAQAKLCRYGTILEPPVEPHLSLRLHCDAKSAQSGGMYAGSHRHSLSPRLYLAKIDIVYFGYVHLQPHPWPTETCIHASIFSESSDLFPVPPVVIRVAAAPGAAGSHN